MELAGKRGSLDDAQRATQSKGDSREAGGEPGADADRTRIVSRTRTGCGRSWPGRDRGHGLTMDAAAGAARTWSWTGCGHGRGADANCFRIGRGRLLDRATAGWPSPQLYTWPRRDRPAVRPPHRHRRQQFEIVVIPQIFRRQLFAYSRQIIHILPE